MAEPVTVPRLPATASWWLRRAALAVVVVWGAATLTFVGLHLLPGNPAQLIAGGGSLGGAPPQVIRLITREYGFDRPLIVQYGEFLGQLIHGNLGLSYQLNQPVSALIFAQIGASVPLALGAAVIGVGVALAVALATAGRRRARAVASPAELVLVATPSFWAGIIALTVFSFRLHWFPVIGNNGLKSLVLPWLTLALPIAGALSQVMRDGIERALDQPFAITVLSRGSTQDRLRLRHALRHALLPVLTLSGLTVSELLGGVVVVETVFARAGIGELVVQAVSDRDFPIVTGVVILSALTLVLINTAVDALYLVVDPRLRAQPR